MLDVSTSSENTQDLLFATFQCIIQYCEGLFLVPQPRLRCADLALELGVSPGGALGEMDRPLATARGTRAEHQAISEPAETGQDEDVYCWGPSLSGRLAECGCDKPPLGTGLLQDRWGHR